MLPSRTGRGNSRVRRYSKTAELHVLLGGWKGSRAYIVQRGQVPAVISTGHGRITLCSRCWRTPPQKDTVDRRLRCLRTQATFTWFDTSSQQKQAMWTPITWSDVALTQPTCMRRRSQRATERTARRRHDQTYLQEAENIT